MPGGCTLVTGRGDQNDDHNGKLCESQQQRVRIYRARAVRSAPEHNVPILKLSDISFACFSLHGVKTLTMRSGKHTSPQYYEF